MSELQKMKNRYLELQNSGVLNMDTIFHRLILETFINELGYEKCKITYSHTENTIDVHIIAENKRKLYLRLINNTSVNPLDIQDFTKFLHQKGGASETYGVLTNGREYLLLNSRFYNQKNDIESAIFWFDLLSVKAPNRQKYFSYLSKRSIIDNNTVDNFKMIAQFKVYYAAEGKSYAQYVSTLEAFFYYLAPPTCSIYANYNSISTQTVYDFLDEKQKSINVNSGRKLNKKTSLNNTYSHICSFYKCLNEHNEIKAIPIETSRKEALRLYPNTQLYRHTMQITKDDISSIKDTLQSSRNPKRNIAILALCAYLGLERKVIYNLNWSNIVEYDSDCPHIAIDNRHIPICDFLKSYFSDLRETNKIAITTPKNIPVFTSGKLGTRLSESAINDVFDSLKKLSNEPGDKWSKMCPQVLRFTLIEELFKSGFSIEEIIYITGIDINNIGKYISNSDIIYKYNTTQKTNIPSLKDKMRSLHPYTDLFNN